jgi:hypothetical protein
MVLSRRGLECTHARAYHRADDERRAVEARRQSALRSRAHCLGTHAPWTQVDHRGAEEPGGCFDVVVALIEQPKRPRVVAIVGVGHDISGLCVVAAVVSGRVVTHRRQGRVVEGRRAVDTERCDRGVRGVAVRWRHWDVVWRANVLAVVNRRSLAVGPVPTWERQDGRYADQAQHRAAHHALFGMIIAPLSIMPLFGMVIARYDRHNINNITFFCPTLAELTTVRRPDIRRVTLAHPSARAGGFDPEGSNRQRAPRGPEPLPHPSPVP